MSNFCFDLQAFAWSHPSEGSWLYSSGSSSFYLNGDYDEDEDDNGNLIPQNTTVSGSNVTIQPDWTTSISIVGGSFNFFDDYESFEAKLSSGDRAVNDDENSVWVINGSGYVYNSYSYYDSDITVTDLDSAPNNRMTLSTISADGFTHYTVDVNGAETSDYTAFAVGSIAFKTVSSSDDTRSIIPNIITINFSSSGPTFVANDYDSTEYSATALNGIYSIYNSSAHVLNLIDGAAYFNDSTNLEINVEGISAGVKIVNDDFVALVANEEYISINTDDPIYVAYDENSWVWDANANTLYFGYNLTMTGISNVSSITAITVTDEQISIIGATLTNAAIDNVTISGTDNNPSNGYIINITDDGYEFADDSTDTTPTVASIAYNANGSFSFTDTNGNSVAYSTASVDFTTMSGALVLGDNSPLNVTISSAADGLIIFDSSVDNTNIVAQLNNGDVFADDHIATDANTINAWAMFEDGDVGLGQNAATTISAITVESTTTIVRNGNLISINNATLESFARIDDNLISGSDTNPADGYLITISGDNASYVGGGDPTVEVGDLASIGYNGSFSFADANGNALAYSNVSSLIATGEGGLITLGADAPDVLTVSSSVDDLIIYNNNGTQTAIMARINAGDSYVSNSLTGSLNDASPINSWITNDELNVINVGTMTLSGVSGLSSATSALFSNNLLTLQNVTLNAASINGSSIAGTDDDPSDGYHISVSGDGYSFVEAQIGDLASIGYNGSFSFADADGNALAYSNVSSLIATGEGGLITLGANAPDVLTVSSSVDDLIIYNNNGTRTAIMARINAGDSYVSNSITGSLNDASPINSWITNDDLNVINVGTMTLSGVSGLSSDTSALFANNLLTLQNVTLNAASINGSSIAGTDDDPSDGYYISVSGDNYSFVSPWSSVEGGFAYNVDNINFTLIGSSLVDNDLDGAPDNVSVSISSVADVGTIMIIGELDGEVSLNGQALGVSGDSSYTVGFIVNGEDFIADSFSNISGGSTVNVDDAIIYIDTEGVLTINDAPITVDNNGYELALTIADGSISAVDNLNGLINGVGNASVAVNGLVTINGVVFWTDDPNGITVSGSTVSGLDANSLLYVSPSGTYVVNSTTLEIGTDSAALGINDNLASTTTLADLRAEKFFDLPDDTEFISADQVSETLNADGTDTFGGSDFDGNKIIELNAKTDIVTGDLTDSSGRKFIVIDGGGDQIVSLGGTESNGVLVEAFADGEKLINAGNNGDTLINNSTAVDITLKGGAGNDSIVAAGGSRELIDVSNGGRDTIVASNGASIKGYDPSTGAAFLNPISTSSLMTAIDNDSLSFGNGTFSIEGNGETTIEGVDASTTINLIDTDGDTVRMIFGNRSDITVGDDDASIDLLLYSDLSELTLLGGAGNDSIFAGENNVVDGGSGNDLLKLRAEGSGSDVVLSTGRDTVENFSGGWDSDTSDRLVLGSGRSTVDYSFGSNALHVSVNGSSMIIPSLKTDTATKIFTSTTIDDAPRRTLLIDARSTCVVTDDERADQYVGLGNRVGLNLSAQTTDETINLNGDDYQNIAAITLGSGNNSLVGSSDDETIVAGLGRSTISSGDGNDVLIASTSDDKVGGSTFVYTNGLDTLRNFEAVGADSDTADEIVFNGRLTGVEIFGNDLVIEAGSVDQLTVVDAANEKIKFNGFVFEVGDDMIYGDDVDAYIGLGDATLNVGASGGNVWLNGVLGGVYSGIRVLDGSEATADATLVGNELNNWIVGGSGNNSLWGGGSSNDTLNAGLGYNEYYYVYGDGNDVINNARDDDVIKLLGIGLEDIDQSTQRITGDAIALRFNDGGSLTVYSRTDVQFEFKDGSRWSADRSSRSWYSRS